MHFGSLLTAIASFLQARTRNGRWLLRIEDIDPPREKQGASEAIIAALGTYGFEWHGPVLYQSHRAERHRESVASLLESGLAYRCGCSRKLLSQAARGPLGPIYPGTCRAGTRGSHTAVRVRTRNEPVSFDDRLQGFYSQRLETESGDFVIQRRDRLVAYHLAVVVDDFEQGVSEVLRGIDLLDSTPRQIHLQRLLNFRTPDYAHIPVAVNAAGQKLSKLTGATALPLDKVGPVLHAALRALHQEPPPDLAKASVSTIWQWATENWTLDPLRLEKSVADPMTL